MDFYIKFINVKKGNDPIAIKELIKRRESSRYNRSDQRLSSLYISGLANTKFHCNA